MRVRLRHFRQFDSELGDRLIVGEERSAVRLAEVIGRGEALRLVGAVPVYRACDPGNHWHRARRLFLLRRR